MAFLYEMSEVSPENIVYVDETGIDSYLYREYGYAPCGELVYGRISGRKHARVGIAAALKGQDILVPMEYNGTMDHQLFENWFENQLLLAVPKGTVIVLDNASFHRKETLCDLAEAHECFVMFLPPYSPELNPIEHFWSWLKNTLREILPRFDHFSDALCAAFQSRKLLPGT